MSYADRIVPALEELADLLTTAGVPAATDRARLQLPGAWVTSSSIGEVTLAGSATLRASVFLVAPAAGDWEPVRVLSGLLAKALTVIDPDEDPATDALIDTSVILNVRSNPLPAFRLAVDLPLEE